MAQATMLPDGMYEVQLDDGSTYTTPEYIARDMAPDSFQDAYDQAAAGAGGYAAEVPPWEMGAQEAAPVMDFAPGVIEQPPEMTFSEAEAGPADVFPGSGASWAAEQGLGAQPQQGPGSRSFGVSVAGTGPYREAPPGQFSAPPSYADERSMAALGARDEIAAAKRGSDAASAYAGRVDELNQDREIQRQETYEQWDAMHAKAMQGAEQREAEIQQAISQIPKMDPQRIWSNTDNATKFGGIMAAAVAGWLHPGKPNEVIAQMQALADRDARAQQTDIETAKFRVGAAERAYGRYADRAAQDKSDYIARRAFLEAGIINTLAAEKEKYQSVITQSNFDAMIGASKRNLAGLLQASRQAEYTNIFNREREIASNQQRAADRRQRAAQFRISQKAAAEERAIKRAQAMGKGAVGEALYSFDGNTVYAGKEFANIGAEELKQMRQKATVERDIARMGNRMLLLLQQRDSRTRALNPNARAEIEREMSEFRRLLRPETGANFTEMERKELDSFFGNPKAFMQSPDKASELIKKTVDGASRRIMSHFSGYNPQVITGSQQVDVEGFGPVDVPTTRRVDINENLLPQELRAVELSEVVPQHIRKFAQEVEAAKEAFSARDVALQRYSDRIMKQEAPVGAGHGYSPDPTSDPEFRAIAEDREHYRNQLKAKTQQLIEMVDQFGITAERDPDIVNEISGYLTSVEDIIGPQMESPIGVVSELTDPEPLPYQSEYERRRAEFEGR